MRGRVRVQSAAVRQLVGAVRRSTGSRPQPPERRGAGEDRRRDGESAPGTGRRGRQDQVGVTRLIKGHSVCACALHTFVARRDATVIYM